MPRSARNQLAYPLTISRPARAYDGSDTVEQMGPTDNRTLWADVEINEVSTQVTCHADADVRIGDLVKVPYNFAIRR